MILMKFQSQNRRGKTVTTKQRKRKGRTCRANPGVKKSALEFYENDLPSPNVVDVELLRWTTEVRTRDWGAALPTSVVQTLAA